RQMPPVSKPLAAFCTLVGAGSRPVSKKLPARSVLMPISPRRYQPPQHSAGGGGGGMSGMSAASAAGMVVMTAAPASASFFRLPMTQSLLTQRDRRNGDPHVEPMGPRWQEILKWDLTLLLNRAD